MSLDFPHMFPSPCQSSVCMHMYAFCFFAMNKVGFRFWSKMLLVQSMASLVSSGEKVWVVRRMISPQSLPDLPTYLPQRQSRMSGCSVWNIQHSSHTITTWHQNMRACVRVHAHMHTHTEKCCPLMQICHTYLTGTEHACPHIQIQATLTCAS